MKKSIILAVVIVLVIFILYPSDESKDDYVEEFNTNIGSFERVKNLTCKSDGSITLMRAEPDDVENEELSELLDDLSIKQIVVNNNDGRCTITLVRAVTGFAGSGYSYKFRFNLAKPNIFDENIHNIQYVKENALKTGDDLLTYDIVLKNGWYLTYTQS